MLACRALCSGCGVAEQLSAMYSMLRSAKELPLQMSFREIIKIHRRLSSLQLQGSELPEAAYSLLVTKVPPASQGRLVDVLRSVPGPGWSQLPDPADVQYTITYSEVSDPTASSGHGTLSFTMALSSSRTVSASFEAGREAADIYAIQQPSLKRTVVQVRTLDTPTVGCRSSRRL